MNPSNGNLHYLTGSTPNTPYWKLAAPVTVSSLGPIGIACIFEVFDGANWAVDSHLRSVGYGNITGPTVGSTAMPGGTGLYHRTLSASPSMPGNFDPGDYQHFGFSDPTAFRGIDLQVWTADVPATSTTGLLIAAGLFAARRNR